MGEQGFAEFGADFGKGGGGAVATEVADDVAGQAGGVGEGLGDLARIAGGDRTGQDQGFEDGQEGLGIVAANEAIGLGVAGGREKCRGRQDVGLMFNVAAAVEMDAVEVAEAPRWEAGETVELVLVMTAQ